MNSRILTRRRNCAAIIVALLLTCSCFGGQAQHLRIATAANLQGVIRVLAADFSKRSGVAVEPVTGSSGYLAAQIRNGAPFDVFLSADTVFPSKLYREGLALGKPVIYASGKLIICSARDIGLENWERTLMSPVVKRVVIANPALAPYGRAASEALRSKGILNEISQKLVYGESIAQVNTYILGGHADVGFTSAALLKDLPLTSKLYWKAVDPRGYTPIRQGMVILRNSRQQVAARRFYDYMQTGPAAKILEDYGYSAGGR